ncbi:similar to Saccharomyces cerevisiae YDR356W SPC110 Inner plaque spindle pole body (SPB) component, ortholog of human kendrin [Maudiozyma saulgeensis]|uniref:Spindle pole body component 110 n=1 Tax=Maudiozyma saulgeensis TaxID=1789683 RepID=A0A1X7R365_9SACH|nr:similar to Saccharomyces cerevisiae YDR356W SPC110 Inner plaque spindle pole body (SPB) component, ortholog of human kendrin [Kazachstania saulgeensis]
MSNTAINSKNSEFTPIGYLSNKRRKLSNDKDELKSPSSKYIASGDNDAELSFDENLEDPGDDHIPSRKAPRSADDDTINSNNLFTENSQFDNDTLPEIPDITKTNNVSTSGYNMEQYPKNLLSNLNNATMSEPIKEQQEMTKLLLSGKRLSNAQINFFLQYLKNSNIFGNNNNNKNSNNSLMGDSGADQERYNALYADYQVLQRKYSDLADSNTQMNDDNDDTNNVEIPDHSECELKQKQLEDTIEGCQKELKILKEQHQKKIQDLKKQNEKLNVDIETQRATTEDQKLDNDSNLRKLRETIHKLEDEAQLLERKYKTKINDLENQLLDLKNGQKHSVSELENQLHSKDLKMSTFESQLKDLTEQKNMTSQKLATVTKELDDKTQEFDQYKSQMNKKLSTEELNDKELHDNNKKIIQKYEKEIETLSKTKDDIEKELQEYKAKLIKTEKNLSVFQEKHSIEVKYLHDSLDKLNEDSKETSENITKLREQISNKDKEISQNVFMIKRLKEKIQLLETNTSPTERHTNLVKELDDKLEEIDQLKKKVNHLETSKNDQIEELGIANSKLSLLNKQLKEANDELKTTQELLEAMKKDANNKQATLDETNRLVETLQKSLKSAPSGNDSTLIDLRQKFKEQQEKLKLAETTNKKLHDQIIQGTVNSVNEVNKDIEEKNERIKDLENNVDIYKQRLKTMEGRIKNYEDLLEELKDPHNEALNHQMDEIKKLTQMLQTRNKEMHNLDLQIVGLKNSNKLLQKEMIENSVHMETLNEQDKQINTLELNIEKLKRECNELKKMNKEQINQIEDLLKQRKLVNDNYNIVKNLNTEYKNELQATKGEYLNRERDLNERLLDLENSNMKLKAALNREQLSNESRSRDTDLRDYYRLKYHREVRHNNDLRMINYYLNRVSQRTSRQMKMDYRKYNRILSDSKKFEESLNDYDYIEQPRFDPGLRYNYNNSSNTSSRNDVRPGPSRFPDNSSPLYFNSPRLKFKTVAKFVQACVRMKQVALKNHWDEQRIRHLERRIDSSDNSANWTL